jgi:hypothetical protein
MSRKVIPARLKSKIPREPIRSILPAKFSGRPRKSISDRYATRAANDSAKGQAPESKERADQIS